jgi:GAF domain-containing protein
MDIPDDIMSSWQSVVDIMAELLEVPAGLIMRIDQDEIEVLTASRTASNPYRPGEREQLFGSGFYCEHVIKTRSRLSVPNAVADPVWCQNPDIKLNMISYLGFPIMFPTGAVFGTICVLDTRTRVHSALHEKLILKFRAIIEQDLAQLCLNQQLEEKNTELEHALREIKTLQGIIPICMYCKRVRDDAGYWEAVEQYVTERSDALFSHSICPPCRARHLLQANDHGAPPPT